MAAFKKDSNGTPANAKEDVLRGSASDNETAGQVVLQLVPPFYGEAENIEAVPGQSYQFNFDASLAIPSISGSDFVLSFDTDGDGQSDSSIVIENLLNVARTAEGSLIPDLIVDGTIIPADQLIEQVLALAAGEETLETAAGGTPPSGGGTRYDDDLGSIIDLLQAQGPLGDTELGFGGPGFSEFISDPAEGTFTLTFGSVVTEAPIGGITGSFSGGFEDALPNQHVNYDVPADDQSEGDQGSDDNPFNELDPGNDGTTFAAPMQLNFNFDPADNEDLDSVTLTEIEGYDGSGAETTTRLFVGGFAPENEVTAPLPLVILPENFGAVYVLPPKDSDEDISFSGTAQISDPDSGLENELPFETTAVVDAVADVPDFDVTEEQANVRVEEEQQLSLFVRVDLRDTDGSESLYLEVSDVPASYNLVDLPEGWSAVRGNLVDNPEGFEDLQTWVITYTGDADPAPTSFVGNLVFDTSDYSSSGESSEDGEPHGRERTGAERGASDVGDAGNNVIVRGEDGPEILLGRDGNDRLFGSDRNDRLSGHSGDDLLVGRDGRDTLRGGAGDDVMVGGDGNDRLIGGPGSDLFAGGSGDDEYFGNGEIEDGVDIFVLNAPEDGVDTISGFQSGDKLNLHEILRSLPGLEINDIDLDDPDSVIRAEVEEGDTLISVNGVTVARIVDYTGVTNSDLEFLDRLENVITEPESIEITVKAYATEAATVEGDNGESGGELTEENNVAVSQQSYKVTVVEDVPTITSVTIIHDETPGIQNDLGKDDVALDLPPELQEILAAKAPDGLGNELRFGDPIGVARNSFTYDLKTDGSNDESGEPHSDSPDQSQDSSGENDGLENLSFDIVNGQDSGLRTVDGLRILLYRDEENDNIVYGVVEDSESDAVVSDLAFIAVLQEGVGGLSDGEHTGTATYIQYLPLRHPVPGESHDEQADNIEVPGQTGVLYGATIAEAPTGGGQPEVADVLAGNPDFGEAQPLSRNDLTNGGNNVGENLITRIAGQIWLEAGQTYEFRETVDDGASLTIDGQQILNDNVWDQSATGAFTPGESGFYSFEFVAINWQGLGSYQLEFRTQEQSDWQAIEARPELPTQPDLSLQILITDDEGDSSVARLNIDIHDDGPSITTSGAPVDALAVDESDLSVNATASFADNFDVDGGADGVASVRYALSLTGFDPQGRTFIDSELLDSQTGEPVYLFLENGVVTGRVGGPNGYVSFRLSVDAETGDVTLDQLRELRHFFGGPDDTLTLPDSIITLTATVTDNDGDTASETLGLGDTITFRDDIVTIGQPEFKVADEDGLREGLAGAVDRSDAPGEAVFVTGNLDIDFGNDDANPGINDGITPPNLEPVISGYIPGDRGVAFAPNAIEALEAQRLTSGGQELRYELSAFGEILRAYAGSQLVFKVELKDTGTGAYEFELYRPLDHGADPEQIENEIDLRFHFTAADADGDQAFSSFVVAIDDDSPETNSADNAVVDEEGLRGGNRDVGYGEPSGARDPGTGEPIRLYKAGPGIIEGRVGDEDGAVAFRFTVENNGRVDFRQLQGIRGSREFDPEQIKTLARLSLLEDAPGDVAGAEVTARGDLNISFGADRGNSRVNGGIGSGGPVAGDRSVTFAANIIEQFEAMNLTSGGRALSYELLSGGTVLRAKAGSGEGDTVFIVRLHDTDSGSYFFQLFEALDHPSVGNSENNVILDFNFVATDADGDQSPGSFSVTVNDDTPVIGNPRDRSVDEEGLQGGNRGAPAGVGGDIPGEALSARGSLDISFGSDDANSRINGGLSSGRGGREETVDGDRAVTFASNAVNYLEGLGLTSGGEELFYLLVANGTRIIAIAPNKGTVFTVNLLDTGRGAYEFRLQRQLDHPEGQGENDINLTFLFTATDSDGDQASSSFNIRVNDDTPVLPLPGSYSSRAIDEGQIGRAISFRPAVFQPARPGADSDDPADALDYSLSVDGVDGTASGLVDSETGQPILLYSAPGNDQHIDGRVGGPDGDIAFRLDVDGTGYVVFQQLRAVRHSEDADLERLENVELTASFTDDDGDTVSRSIDLGSRIFIRDDEPVARHDVDSVTEDGATVATGNVITGQDVPENPDANSTDGVADDPGADGLASIAWDNQGDANEVQGLYGTLRVEDDGSYRYTLNNNNPTVQALDDGETLTETFRYTISDRDGDVAAANLTITINGVDDQSGPDISIAGPADTLTVDETDLDTNARADFSDNFRVTGGEGATVVRYTLSIRDGNGADSGLRDSETGQLVRLYRTESGVIEGRAGDINGALVFTLTVAASGEVTLDQLRAVRHPDTTDHDDAVTLDANVISLTATVEDEGNRTDSESIGLGENLVFEDDGPQGRDDTRSVDEGDPVRGNVLGNDDAGNDGGLKVSEIRKSGAQDDTDVGSGSPQTIRGDHGELTIHQDGSFTYEADSGLSKDEVDSFVYTITDQDGDEDEVTLTFNIDNEGDCILLDPKIPEPRQLINDFDRDEGDRLNLYDVLEDLRESSGDDPDYDRIRLDPDIVLDSNGRLLADGIQIGTVQSDQNFNHTRIVFNEGLGHSIVQRVQGLTADDFCVEDTDVM